MSQKIFGIVIFLGLLSLGSSSNSVNGVLEERVLEDASESNGEQIGFAFGIARRAIIGTCMLACLIDPARAPVLLAVLMGFSNLSHLRFINVNLSAMADGILTGEGQVPFNNLFIYFFSKVYTTEVVVNQAQIDYHYTSTRGLFQQRGVSCLFLDNYGPYLSELLILFALMIIFLGMKWLSQKLPMIIQRLINGVLHCIKYNLIIAIFLGNFDELILAFSLQSYQLFDSTYAKASLIIGNICIPLTVIALILLLWVSCKMYKIQKECMYLKKELPAEVDYIKKQFDVLLAGLKYQHKRQFFFFQLIMFQRLWFIVAIFTLNTRPMAQTLIVMFITLSLIILTFIIRPFGKKLTAVVLIYNECCVLVFTFLCLALLANSENQTIITNTGYAIFGLMLAIASGNGAFACFLLGFALRERFCPKNPHRDIDTERKENKMKRRQTQLDETQKKLHEIAKNLNTTNKAMATGNSANPFDNTIVEDDPENNRTVATSVIQESKEKNVYFNKSHKEDFARGAKLPLPTIWRPGEDPIDKIESDITEIKLKIDSMLRMQTSNQAPALGSLQELIARVEKIEKITSQKK